MRKVFLSTMLSEAIKAPVYISDDVELSDSKYNFPLTYVLENDVEAGDEILVATAVPQNNYAQENYELYKEEIERATAGKEIKLTFVELKSKSKLGSSAFHRFFKEVSKVIKDNDRLYMDITFGDKPYSMAMFIAGAYGVKACTNTDIENVICAQKYTDDHESQQNTLFKIYDLTGLFYINEMTGAIRPGDKRAMDTLLNMIIRD